MMQMFQLQLSFLAISHQNQASLNKTVNSTVSGFKHKYLKFHSAVLDMYTHKNGSCAIWKMGEVQIQNKF